jgi:Flp pilus assembly protein TadG
MRMFREFLRNKAGNFAMLTAIALPMLLSAAALGLDMTNVLRTKTELQDANDAAVLFAARHFKETRRQPTQAQVRAALQANFIFEVTASKLTFNVQKTEFTLESVAKTKTFLMGYFGESRIKYEVVSKAGLGFSETLEFALALDTTGSMSVDGKMDALKSAANGFIDVMWDARSKGADVRGAIVPFAQYVNVGVSRRREAWISVPADEDTRKTVTVCRREAPVVGQTNCRNECWPASTINHPGRGPNCSTNDGVRSCDGGESPWTENRAAGCDNRCDPVYGAEQDVCGPETSGQLITWHGCVGSRAYPLNVRDGDYRNRIPGLLGITCSDEVQPLTASSSVLRDKINALSPSGETYMPEGVMWGTRMLTTQTPFREGKTSGGGGRPVRKALIVMTDGMNTLSPDGMFHTNTDTAQANIYTAEACDEAKRQAMDVFTISFGAGVNSDVQSMLATCASNPDQYFHAANGAALTKAFQDIADALLSIRLTQ